MIRKDIQTQTRLKATTLATLANYFWLSRRPLKSRSQLVSDALDLLISYLQQAKVLDADNTYLEGSELQSLEALSSFGLSNKAMDKSCEALSEQVVNEVVNEETNTSVPTTTEETVTAVLNNMKGAK